MKLLETKFEIKNLQQSQSMNTPTTTKVRRKLFAADTDSTPLNAHKIRNDAVNLLNEDYERFKDKYNYDFDKNNPLEGPWDWKCVDSDRAPSFYIQPYIAKTAESLKKHHMSCLKDRDQYLRNNSPFYSNGNGHYFQSLATNLLPTCGGDDDAAQMRTTSSTTTSTTMTSNGNNMHPVLHATPYKQRSNLFLGSSSCGTKRKLSQEDDDDSSNSSEAISEDNADDGDTNTIDNLTFPDTSSSSLSPLRSSSSETLLLAPSTTHQLSTQSQDSVGYNLQNKLCAKTTTGSGSDNHSSSQTTPQTSLLAQGNYLRQTNIKEYMKSQKNASEPVAKQARTA